MPLNGGGMDNGRAGGVTTPGSTDFPVGLEIQNPFLFTIQKLVLKKKHGSYLLRFSTMTQFETVLPRKTNQGRCRVQVLHTVVWMCSTALVFRLRQCCIYKCKNNSLVLLEIQEVFLSASLRSCEYNSLTEMSSSNPNFSRRSGP